MKFSFFATLLVLTFVCAGPLRWYTPPENKPDVVKKVAEAHPELKKKFVSLDELLKRFTYVTKTERWNISAGVSIGVTVPPKPTKTPWKREVEEVEATTTLNQYEVDMNFPGPKPDILHHYDAFLNNHQNQHQAVAIARSVELNVALAKSTPTYNGRNVLKSIFSDVPKPSGHEFDEIIDDIVDSHSQIDRLMDLVVVPFLGI